MWRLEGADAGTCAAPSTNPVRVFVILVDVVGAIAIGHIEPTVWGERDVGRREPGLLSVEAAVLRILHRPELFAC